MARVGVCLSGCGVQDGSEIHEAVLTLLALDQAGAEILCCAPDIEQKQVVNHLTGKPVAEKRNVLCESARIARGKITNLAHLHAVDLDALILPGGMGAATNLCTFATQGAICQVDPHVERLLHEMLDAKKPIGAICIAPALLARVVAATGRRPTVTIGTDATTAATIEKTGAQHRPCAADSIVIDHDNLLITTPAYMLANGPAETFAGIKALVDQILQFIN